MYASAAPTTYGLEGFRFAGGTDPGLLDWLVFYGFMLVDTLLLGAPQALFGEMAALRPASWMAAVHIFLVRSLMAVGVIWAIWSEVRDLLVGRREFSGTVDELLEWLKQEEPDEEGVGVVARAIEEPVRGCVFPAGPLRAFLARVSLLAARVFSLQMRPENAGSDCRQA